MLFLSCKSFVVNTTFSTGLVGVEVKGKLILTETSHRCKNMISRVYVVLNCTLLDGLSVLFFESGCKARRPWFPVGMLLLTDDHVDRGIRLDKTF